MGQESDGGNRRPDSQQLVRQWAILRLLAESGRAFTVKELADQLGASKSTIQRDLATLEQPFALIEEQVGKQKKAYRIEQSIRGLEDIRFGTAELLALHGARAAFDSLAGTPLHADLCAVARKLRGVLSDQHNGGLDNLARVFQPHPRGYVDYRDHQEIIDDLVDAIARRRACAMVYRSAWQGTTRTHAIHPLRLVWHRLSLYLLAQVAGRSEITTFAVQRIESLEVESRSFTDPRLDVAEHARRAFGIFVSDAEEEVEILFDPDIAWRVEERVFHPDEDKHRLPDGRLRYRVRSSAQWEVLPWVLSFGGLAELRAPEAWRLALADAARAMCGIYEAPSGEPRSN